MNADMMNAAFELGGAFAILGSIRVVLKDREVKGVSWAHVAFFAIWGGWNLIYYPAVGHLWSWVAGLCVFAANSVYCALLIVFSRKRKKVLTG